MIDLKLLITKQIKPREITKNEIIELRLIGIGSMFMSVLYYYIEYERLVVIKKKKKV